MAAKRALLIGPSYSPDLPADICGPLEGPENDVRLMKDMLSRSGFQSEDIETLVGDEASRDKILSSLEKLSFTAEKGSVVVIYFSGHGYQLTQEKDQGLLPAGLTRQMVDQYHIYDVCITGEHFKPHLLRLIQKDCLVNTIFDCCFSGRLYRGYGAKEGPTLRPKMLKLSDEYINKCLKSAGVKHLKEPSEQCDGLAFSVPEGLSTSAVPSVQMGQECTEPNEHESHQETQPPNPMQLPTQLKHPVQEFWNRMLKAQGWKPSQHDKFIHIAASSSNQKAYEVGGHGCLTLALVEAIDEARQENKKISYSILKSLIKRKFVEKGWNDQTPQFVQTPQFEGGKMDLMLFSTSDTVPQVNAFEIIDVKRDKDGFYKVSLNAGHLHGVVEGEYDICREDIPDETAASRNREKIYGYYIDTLMINPGDIDMLKSRGATPYNYDRKIQVGCKAILCRRHSMFTPILMVAPPELSEEDRHRMVLSLETQNMFNIEAEERQDCVTLDITTVEDKQCWRACQNGRMIVPYHLTGDEHLMAKNLSKYFRHKFAIKPKHANDNMLTNVSFKVFKVKNVPSFKGSPDKKNELIAKAIQTPDLSGGDPPTFRAHKVELENSLAYRRRYKVIDGSGDALVIQVTNNENRFIHVCVISYQADGSIVVLHPPRKGNTEVLEQNESMCAIKRVLLEPDTVRRMVEPDFDKEKPKSCKDVMILYATTEPTDYEPLTQTAIELSPKLSTRGPNQPDGLLLASSYQFRNALHPPRDYLQPARDGDEKWLTIKREIIIEYNDDP